MGSHTAQLSDRVVLVVDDEDMVCQFMARIMTDAGFRVVQAHDGEEAATYLQTLGAEAISLVISDITMPRLNGLQLAALMSVHWPAVPIVLASGQGGPPSGYQGPFIRKPFKPETLLAAVSEVMPMNAPPQRNRAS
jgi:DNA-binding NtrC family response regulator